MPSPPPPNNSPTLCFSSRFCTPSIRSMRLASDCLCTFFTVCLIAVLSFGYWKYIQVVLNEYFTTASNSTYFLNINSMGTTLKLYLVFWCFFLGGGGGGGHACLIIMGGGGSSRMNTDQSPPLFLLGWRCLFWRGCGSLYKKYCTTIYCRQE